MLQFSFSKVTNLFLFVLLAVSCKSTKHLSEDEQLIVKQVVKENGTELSKDPVLLLSQTKVNNKIAGLPLRLYLYNLANKNPGERFDAWLNQKSKRKERLSNLLSEKQVNRLQRYSIEFSNWLQKNGEPPSLVDSTRIDLTQKLFTTYYNNLGYFNTKSTSQLKGLPNKKAEIIYEIDKGNRFYFDSITSVIASPDVDSLYRANKQESFLKKGDPFIVDKINAERDRIIQIMANNGIQNFQQRSIRFKAFKDSLGIDTQIPVVIEIKNAQQRIRDTLREIPYHIQKIDEVKVFIEEIDNRFSIYTDSISYNGYTLFSVGKLKYKPQILTQGIRLKKGDVYRADFRKSTYKYFNELQNFKYPTITYTPQQKDSTLLDASIFLRPKERFSLGFDADVSHSNIQDIGITLGSSVISRNIFRGAEILEVGVKGTVGSSRDVAEEKSTFFNLFEVGGNINLRIPRLWAPKVFERLFFNNLNARTNVLLGVSLQENIGLDRQSFTGKLEYVWRPKKYYTYTFKLADIEFVNNKAIDNYFNVYRNSYDRLNEVARSLGEDSPYLNENNQLPIPQGTTLFINDVLNNRTSLRETDKNYTNVATIMERKNRLTANNFIVGSSFTILRNTQENIIDENFSQFRLKIESVGNLLNAFLKAKNTESDLNGSKTIFNLAPSQYIKTEVSLIKHWETGNNRILAFRGFGGIALPYGNANFIPFTRSYYGGGANDNRAWNAYKLGPGRTSGDNEFNEANLKIAFNLEYRFPLIGPLKGALFADAGNIWNINNNISDPAQVFNGFKDLQEIALGTGVGIRYDFDYFIFRLDTAFKTYDPSQPKTSRWGSQMRLKNAVFNIGINYPF